MEDLAKYKEQTTRLLSLANSMNMDANLLIELAEERVAGEDWQTLSQLSKIALEMKGAALAMLAHGNRRVNTANGWMRKAD